VPGGSAATTPWSGRGSSIDRSPSFISEY